MSKWGVQQGEPKDGNVNTVDMALPQHKPILAKQAVKLNDPKVC